MSSSAPGPQLAAEIGAGKNNPCTLRQVEGGPNADRLFYVIWRSGRAGLFSLLSSVLAHLSIATRLGATPVVDLENFPSVYSESQPVNDSANAWTYYFEPVSDATLDEVYASANVLLCSGEHPADATMNVSTDPRMLEIYDRYVRLNGPTARQVEEVSARIAPDERTLGVQFRGGEMRTTPIHPFPPTERQMISLVQNTLDTAEFDRVFLLTEREEYVRSFRRALGDRLACTESYRGDGRNAYDEYARPLHRYRLGLEVLTDTMILSRCGGLVFSSSNVSEAAIMLNRGRYRLVRKAGLGTNVGDPRLARVMWPLKRLLPEALGGFPRELRPEHVHDLAGGEATGTRPQGGGRSG